ncbi:MAG TPA: hypothetical protein VMN38_08600 [Sphingomicrobium sp.]|nr:hypothetical protein [Sphingomicrobium sp.]
MVPAGQECRATKTNLLFGLPLPSWLALIALAVIVAGGAAMTYRWWRIRHTAQLLGLSPSLNQSEGRFEDTEMVLDGPPIGFRTRLDLQETSDG